MTNDDPMYLRHLEKALEAAELEIKGLEGELREQDKILAEMQEQLAPTRIGRKTGSDWRNNSSLELWFPFSAEELARWKRAAEANIEENVRLRADLDELRHNAKLTGLAPEGDKS